LTNFKAIFTTPIAQELTLQEFKDFRSLKSDIFLDILFTILSCGLFNIWIQYRQIKALNILLSEEKYSFPKWAIFSILTCGIYHIYHEWRMSRDLAKICGKDESLEGYVAIFVSIIGFSIIVDAIQQSRINEYVGFDQV
jgi:hypothetical protein